MIIFKEMQNKNSNTKNTAKATAKKKFDPKQNYKQTKKIVNYVSRKEATQETYNIIGFKSGLEVHQQLLTDEKLFCHCPAGKYNKSDDYNAEVVRHMRPTLSELGEYDGTALMEFRTRKKRGLIAAGPVCLVNWLI